MINLLNSMKIGYSTLIADGQFILLFYAALFGLFFFRREVRGMLEKYALGMLILLLFPVTAWILLKYQTPFYDYGDLWMLLPITVVIAYVMTLYEDDLENYLKSKNRRRVNSAPGILLGAILLFLCGNLTVFGNTQGVGAGDYYPAEVKEVLEVLEIEEESIMLLAPDEITAYARIYDGRIHLPYGRLLSEPELSAYTYDAYAADKQELHDWVAGTLIGMDEVEVSETYLSLCTSYGFEYLVFESERHKDANLLLAISRQESYREVYRTDTYVVYRLQ